MTCPDFNFDDGVHTIQVVDEVIVAPVDEEFAANETPVDESDCPLTLVDLRPVVVEPIVEDPEDGGSSLGSMGVQAETAHITEQYKVFFPFLLFNTNVEAFLICLTASY